MLQLLITDITGTTDIASMVGNITWSGDYKSAARSLEFSFPDNPVDETVPFVALVVGSAVCLQIDGETLFEGFIVRRDKRTDNIDVSIRCFDRGMFLKGNDSSYQFSGKTPEEATAQLCADFGITTGDLAKTDHRLSRNFIGKKLYDIVMDLYTLASESSGDKFYARFVADKFCVFKKERAAETIIIQGGSNLMDASVSESTEKIVNRVAIIDKAGKEIRATEDSESIAMFGLFQQAIADGDNADKSAKTALENSGVDQKITVNILGDLRCTTGQMVCVQEVYTGLWGEFYIDGDSHTWKRGQHYTKLTLNFKNLMDEKEVAQKEEK